MASTAPMTAMGRAHFDGVGAGTTVGLDMLSWSVSQDWTNRLSTVGYKIQKQGLQRTDIDDLMSLTTSRMDTYHVVGILLLSFCISWFSGGVAGSELPSWFDSLFLISNICAVGYLVISVWLALHASTAAHSVGVRLKTSVFRLSIPDPRTVEGLKMGLFSVSEHMKNLPQQVPDVANSALKGLQSSRKSVSEYWKNRPKTFSELMPNLSSKLFDSSTSSASDVWQSSVRVPHGTSDISMATFERNATMNTESEFEEPAPCYDDQKHFHCFLEEQSKWLSYDAYARLCMTLGMNQMLQALSYFVVGHVQVLSLFPALLTFFAVDVLAYLMMRLDTRDDFHSRKQTFLWLFIILLPALFSGPALFLALTARHEKVAHFLSTPTFMIHSTILGYIGSHMQKPRKTIRREGVALPLHLRTVNYLNVVELHRQRVFEVVHSSEVRSLVAWLQSAREALRQEMESIMAEETSSMFVSHARRLRSECRRLKQRLAKRLHEAKDMAGVLSDLKAEEELVLSEDALDNFDMWQDAPRILNMFDALRSSRVRRWLEVEQNKVVDKWYAEFLNNSIVFDLGIVMTTDLPFGGQERTALKIALDEASVVHVEDGASDVWIDTVRDEEAPGPPTHGGYVTYHAFVEQVTLWSSAASQAAERRLSRSRRSRSLARVAQEEAPRPNVVVQPDELPGFVVRNFTLSCAFLWTLVCVMHIWRGLSTSDDQSLSPNTVEAVWPEPSALFEVRSLHCNGSVALVRDSHTLYSFSRPNAGELWYGSELGYHDDGVSLCDTTDCHAQTATLESGLRLMLEPADGSLGPTVENTEALVSVWAHSSSRSGVVARWDGEELVVTTLRQHTGAAAWNVLRRLPVRPSASRCGNGIQCHSESKYRVVQALQLGHEGRSLTVLSTSEEVYRRSFLDVWDLESGTLSGRWFLKTQYDAMCHDSRRLLFARRGVSGPVVEGVDLPFWRGLTESRGDVFETRF